MAFDIVTTRTFSDIAGRLCERLGMSVPSDVAGATDRNVVRLRGAINDACNELLGMYCWEEFTEEGSISVVATVPGESETEFDLPDDYFGMIPQTSWNNDSTLPNIGPVSPQNWQTYKVGVGVGVISFLWRIRKGKMVVLDAPSTAQTMTFEYISMAWCQDGDNPTLYKNYASKNSDLILFDDYYVLYLARAIWREMLGYDSSAARRDLVNMLENRQNRKNNAPVLNLAGRGSRSHRYLDGANIPERGYGS